MAQKRSFADYEASDGHEHLPPAKRSLPQQLPLLNGYATSFLDPVVSHAFSWNPEDHTIVNSGEHLMSVGTRFEQPTTFAEPQGSIYPASNFMENCSTSPAAAPCQGQPRECYGMICEVAVRLQSSLTVFSIEANSFSKILGGDGVPCFRFQLSFENQGCRIISRNNREIGVLNTKISNLFERLHDTMGLSFDCFITHSSVSGVSRTTGRESHAAVDINVYGIHEVSDDVAKELSENGYFLQDPYWIPEQWNYINPQYLEIPEFLCHNLEEQGATPKAGRGEEGSLAGLEEDKNAEIDFEKILDALASHDYLDCARADTRIKTVLLSHQKEGLDFVKRRETLSNSSRRLWTESGKSEDGALIYQHVITGAKSPLPEASRGGIIADEMGLGKSLTILSAIVGSLDNALSYACSSTSVAAGSGQAVIAAKSTLVVVPSSLLMDNWIEEINKHTDIGCLAYHKYHGASRKIAYPILLQNDIILTTYATLASEYGRRGGLLHQIFWYRIVLDEAHVIRNPSTKQFEAITALHGHIRWCLTGTPIQNTLEDLGSLIRFLKEPILEKAAQFRRHITKNIHPAKSNSWKDMENLRVLLSSVCLRRNKLILSFPPLQEYLYELEFSLTEKEKYKALELACRQAIDMAVSGHKVKEAHQTVLEALLRLRLFCNNGIFSLLRGSTFPSEPEDIGSLLQQRGEDICSYCSCDIVSFSGFGDPQAGIFVGYSQPVCGECVVRHEAKNRPIASSHRDEPEPLSTSIYPDFSDGIYGRPQEYPSKIIILCDDIEKHIHESKTIVFSYWKKTLDIVGDSLNDRGIKFLRVDGSMKLSDRKSALSKFQSSFEASVLLMTLGTGAVGLNNLSVASRVHILEPQWNPSVESQAIGRVLRLGQERPVQVIRYIMKDTVEKVLSPYWPMSNINDHKPPNLPITVQLISQMPIQRMSKTDSYRNNNFARMGLADEVIVLSNELNYSRI